MLLEALEHIPGSISIAPGQVFREPNLERAQEWIATGKARIPEAKSPNGSDVVSWKGADVAILASGPSLSIEQAEAVRAWRNADPERRKVIAINTTFRRAPWADMLYACDGQWWNVYHAEAAAEFAGERWTQDEVAAKAYGLRLMRSRRAPGLSRDIGVINQMEAGGFQAIGIAWQAGAARVLLLGFDNSGCHWHGPHPGKLNKVNIFKRWAQNAETLAADCKAAGFPVLNCTPGSALKSFQMATWTEIFR